MPKPKMDRLLRKRVQVMLTDGRRLQGTLLAFDGHMNVVLDETQEHRRTKAGESVQRALGLVVLRGDMVVATNALAPAAGDQGARLGSRQPITMQL